MSATQSMGRCFTLDFGELCFLGTPVIAYLFSNPIPACSLPKGKSKAIH